MLTSDPRHCSKCDDWPGGVFRPLVGGSGKVEESAHNSSRSLLCNALVRHAPGKSARLQPTIERDTRRPEAGFEALSFVLK
jgi:hypothetical protein